VTIFFCEKLSGYKPSRLDKRHKSKYISAHQISEQTVSLTTVRHPYANYLHLQDLHNVSSHTLSLNA